MLQQEGCVYLQYDNQSGVYRFHNTAGIFKIKPNFLQYDCYSTLLLKYNLNAKVDKIQQLRAGQVLP